MPVGVNKKKHEQVHTPKLWLLLIGVNQYDHDLPSLRYPALDCQGLTEALTVATQHLHKEVINYHDFGAKPLLGNLRTSLKHITEQAQSLDTILFYFSGHGILDPITQQCFLCLRDTQKDDLVNTSLPLQELLQMLSQSAARQQLIWLDACHSGGMTLRGATTLLNPTKELVQVLQSAATASKGFYALLSCDINQQSWEFPELGHGVFTYYLMRGLRGEAASQGIITADDLYKYVYHQTLQYIDKTNQQLRLINQQRRSKGDVHLQREYPLQTPKRIVEGVGDVILGNATTSELVFPRVALVIEGMTNSSTLSLSKALRGICKFELEYLPRSGKITTTRIRDGIQSCLRLPTHQELTTALLYLRGCLQETPTGVALSLSNDVWLSRDWLRLQLRRSSVSQLIIILDCVAVESIEVTLIQEWIEDLQVSTDKGLCIIAVVAHEHNSEQFVTALIDTLQSASQSVGLSAAGWISQLQIHLAGALPLHVWLSGTRGIIEIIPATSAQSSKQANIDLNICPYLGLRAFGESDAQYFYGRKSLIQNLINHITTQSFLAVVGASGSGKSSVVQAGLIAQLRLGKQLPGSEKWFIKSIRPGTRPLKALAQIDNDNTKSHLVLEGLLYQGIEGFVYWLRSRPEPVVILFVDQFEELFTLSPEEDRQRFLELVLGALRYASDKFKLIITLRVDFMAPTLEVAALAQLLQSSSVLVPPSLSDDDYRSVIINPAEQVGLKVQAGLVEVLLQELNHSAGDLPLLEFVLEQLWEKRIDGELTLAVYQQHLGGIAGALEKRAQAVYDELDDAAQKCARWIFLSLTQLGEGTEDTRRRVLKSDLAVKKYPPALVERTLQALTTAKLIVMNVEAELAGIAKNDVETRYITSPAQPTVTIEVAHEILIRHWSTLRWWLEENRNRLRLQRQVEHAAQLWKHNHEQTEFLLQGIRLAEAEEIYIKYTDELSFDVQTFIAACLDQHRRLQLEQKKRLRQTQAALAVISILGIAATGFGGFAYLQRQAAQTREVTALNASSEALLNSHSQLEALVASIKASKQLKQLAPPEHLSPDIQLATAATLQQALSLTQEINRLQGHNDKVNAVSISPDNKLIASASDDSTVKLWRRNGQLVKDFKNHRDRVTSVIFSHDNKYIASGGADKTIQLYSIDGKIVKTFTGHNDFVTSLAFSSDSKTLVSGSRDQTMRIWNRENKSFRSINAHNGWVNTVALSPDGKYIVSGGEDNLIKLWQVSDGKLVKIFTGHKDRVTRVLFSSDYKKIVSASYDTIKIWSLNGKELQSLTNQGSSISFSSDGSTLVSGSTDGSIKLWQLNGKLITTYQGHSERVTDISISRDGMIASSSDDKTVRLWNLAKPNIKNHTIYSVAFNPYGQTFATAGWDGAVNILGNNNDNQKIVYTFKAHQSIISAIRFSPNTKILATASADKTVKLWNVKRKQLILTLSGHNDRVTSVAFSPDNNIIATAGADKTVKLWRVQDGKLLHTLTGHTDEVTSVSISTDGLIASGDNDNQIKIWRLDGNLVQTLTGHGSAISSLAFTPDAKILASASWDNTIKLWHSNGKLITTLTGHNDGVTSLSFTSDNQILASGSADNTIKLWNLADNTLIKTLSGYASQINSISFSANNKALIGGSDTGVTLWNLDIDDLIKQSCTRIYDYLQNNRNITPKDKKICK